MQEDKLPVFEAADALELCLAATAGMVRDMRPDRDRHAAAAGRGFATATDLADWLVRVAWLPFRRAHHVTGEIVKRAEALGCSLAELPLAELQAVEPAITAEIYDVLEPRPFGRQPRQLWRHRARAGPRRDCRGKAEFGKVTCERSRLRDYPSRRSAAVRRIAIRACSAIALMLLALIVADCGKKGPPQPPPGVPNVYPRPYPRE